MTLAVIAALLLAQAATPLPSQPVPSYDYPIQTPTPSPECNHAAEVVKAMYPVPTADLPSDSQPLYATLGVLVGPDGTIEKVTVLKSSGNLGFDTASVRAARKSVFKPKMIDCKPVEGPAVFKTSLTPGTPPPLHTH